MLLTLSGRSFIKTQYSSFPLLPRSIPLSHSNALQCYVKRMKCKVNDIILPSGCEVRAINLGNKNMKIVIFTGATSVRSKTIFTDISQYPTGKHEINFISFFAWPFSSASSLSCTNLDILLDLCNFLTLSQMANFRLFQA